MKSNEAGERSGPLVRWNWNSALSGPDMENQIREMKSQGFGGAMIRVAQGLPQGFPSDPLWAGLQSACSLAAQNNFHLWLHDDMTTSSAFELDDMLTRHPEYRMRSVRCYLKTVPAEESRTLTLSVEKGDVLLAALTVGADSWNMAKMMARWKLETVPQGDGNSKAILSGPAVLPPGECDILICILTEASGYQESGEALPRTSYCLDALNPNAVDLWLKTAYGKLPAHLAGYLGTTLRGFHMVVPPMVGRHNTIEGWDREVVLPWTLRLPDIFREKHGASLVNCLTALVADGGPADAAAIRRAYRSEVAALYASSCPGRIRHWCDEHDLLFAGSLKNSSDVASWVANHGDVVRCTGLSSLPAFDLPAGRRDSSKTAQSVISARLAMHAAAKNAGRTLAILEGSATGFESRLSDLHGTTDFLFALGIQDVLAGDRSCSLLGNRLRLPVAAHTEAVPYRDHLGTYTGYAANLSSLLTGSKHSARVALVYPASDWFGASSCVTRAADFQAVVQALIERQLDFDLIHEDDVAAARIENSKLIVAGSGYQALVLPPAVPGREAAGVIAEFRQKGGRVYGPGLTTLAADLKRIPRQAVVEIAGGETSSVLIQERKSGDGDIYIICYAGEAECEGAAVIAGAGSAAVFDAVEGAWHRVEVEKFSGGIRIPLRFQPGMVYVLSPDRTTGAGGCRKPAGRREEILKLEGRWSCGLRQLNTAFPREWSILRKGDWIPVDGDRLIPDFDAVDGMSVRAAFNAGFIPGELRLVCEAEFVSELMLNGKPVKGPPEPVGLPLRGLKSFDAAGLVVKGGNNLEFTLRVPASERELEGASISMVPPVFAAGRFAVQNHVIVPLPEELESGNWTKQGLPRYSGTAVYRKEFKLDGRSAGGIRDRRVWLRADVFGGLMEVTLNGRPAGVRAWAPYEVELTGLLNSGKNTLEIAVTNALSNMVSRAIPSGLAGVVLETE